MDAKDRGDYRWQCDCGEETGYFYSREYADKDAMAHYALMSHYGKCRTHVEQRVTVGVKV
jgi:hypothetical protein